MAATKYLPIAIALCALAAAPARLAPISELETMSTHGPFEMGACNACHDEADRAHLPGRLIKASNDLCYDCHDEFRKQVKRHPSPRGTCTGCHSPHNSRKRKLLL